jgi:hypothetical protein
MARVGVTSGNLLNPGARVFMMFLATCGTAFGLPALRVMFF